MRKLQAPRAWDDVANNMLYARGIEQFDDMLGFRFPHFETEKPVYMWPTGLTDRNGTPIYECDLLKVKINDYGSYYFETFEVLYQPEKVRFVLKDNRDEIWGFTEVNDFEVIGNVYQTPLE